MILSNTYFLNQFYLIFILQGTTADDFNSNAANKAAFCESALILVSTANDDASKSSCTITRVVDQVAISNIAQNFDNIRKSTPLSSSESRASIKLEAISSILISYIIAFNSLSSSDTLAIANKTTQNLVALIKSDFKNVFVSQLVLYESYSPSLLNISSTLLTTQTNVIISTAPPTMRPTNQPTSKPTFKPTPEPTKSTLTSQMTNDYPVSGGLITLYVLVAVLGLVILITFLIYFSFNKSRDKGGKLAMIY